MKTAKTILILFVLLAGCGSNTTCPPQSCPTCPAPAQPEFQFELTSWMEPDHFVIQGTSYLGVGHLDQGNHVAVLNMDQGNRVPVNHADTVGSVQIGSVQKGNNLLTLPTNFKTQLLKKNQPSYILKLVESELQNEQTTQSDWAANSGALNVDYTPTPPAAGDVELPVSSTPPDEENLSQNASQVFYANDVMWQSFKHTESGARTIDLVKLYLTYPNFPHYFCVEIWSAGKATKLSSTQVASGYGGASAWQAFYFSADNLSLQPSTEYWIKAYIIAAPGFYASVYYQNTNVYADGQFDRYLSGAWSYNLGDLAFEVQFKPVYPPSGYIQTRIMDLGSVPTVDGIWRFQNLTPSGTSLTYEAWALDFFSWTSRTIPSLAYLAVAWNGSTFAAVGNNVAATSPDGITWNSQTIPAGIYRAIIWNGSTFVAVGDSVAATSTDGITWNSQTIPAGTYTSVAWNGSTFAAVGSSVAATSTNGITWNSQTIPAGIYYGVAWNGSTFAAVGSSVAATSTNGITWNSQTIPAGTYRAIAGNNSVFMIVGTNISASSFDGITWITRTIPAGTYYGVAWNGRIFSTVGNNVAASTTATSLGAVVNDQPITVRSQYYAVKATLTADAAQSSTPTLQSVLARFPTYIGYSDNPRLGYEAALNSVSALSHQIDDFKPTSVGQMQATLDFTTSVSNYLASAHPKNKEAKIFMGFVADPSQDMLTALQAVFDISSLNDMLTVHDSLADVQTIYDIPGGLGELDYLLYYTGVIKDWSIGENDQVTLKIDDLHIEWDAPVPRTSNDPATGVPVTKTWLAMHPVDVIIDIVQGYVTSTRSDGTLLRGYTSLDYNSLATVKAATPGWTVTRQITQKTEKAKDLLEELRQLLSAYYLPKGTGNVFLKRFSASEAAVMTLTDRDFLTKKWDSNSDSLINMFVTYFKPTWYANRAYLQGERIIPTLTKQNGFEYECTVAGTSHATTEPTWPVTVDNTVVDNGATWKCRQANQDNELKNYVASSVTTDETSIENWDEASVKAVKDPWTQAAQLSQIQDRGNKIVARYGNPAEKLSVSVDMRFFELETGDIVNVTTKRAPAIDPLVALRQVYDISCLDEFLTLFSTVGPSRNLLAINQAGVETNLTGFIAAGTLTRDTTKYYEGTASAKLTTADTVDKFIGIEGPTLRGAYNTWDCAYGQTKSFSAYVYSSAPTAKLRIIEMSAAGGVLADRSSTQTTNVAAWTRLVWDGFTPSNVNCAGVLLRIQSTISIGDIYCDDMQWEEGNATEFMLPYATPETNTDAPADILALYDIPAAGQGIADKPFQVVKKAPDFKSYKINLELLRV